MMNIATAVREIVNTTRKRTAKDPTAFPFFFIVGAGISAPVIPVASRIEAMCREIAERDGLTVPALSDDPMDRYEALLTLINPNAADRQEFLHDLINNAPISPANLRLAHLLESRRVTNIVVTPNFDEMLTKALRLFGVDCVVCDHPKTTQRVNPNRADLLQIVHVHGTHWFYDCCNLRGEISDRATSMADLLDRILFDRSPIVVGYSGWTSDVIMTALARWVKESTRPHNLYWFCHRASEVDRLPNWLRNHASVRFVVEEKPIEAASVFEAFLRETKADAPAVTSDPLPFFAAHLEKTLGTSQEEGDIYLISQVIHRVRRGSELEAEERRRLTEAQRRNADAVARLSDAVRRSAYNDALKIANEIDAEALTIDQCIEVDAALMAFYVAQFRSNPESVREVCPLWQRATERALAASPDDLQRQASAAYALFGESVAIFFDFPEQSLSLLDRVLEKFGSLRVRPIAGAMTNRATLLHSLKRTDEAKKMRQELREKFGDDPSMRTSLDHSALNELINDGVSVATFAQEIVTRYAGETDRPARDLRAFALRAMARELVDLGHSHDALLAADEFLRNYAYELHKRDIGHVLLSKAAALGKLDRTEEAMSVLQEVDRQIEGLSSGDVDELRTSAGKIRRRLNKKTTRDAKK